MSPKNIVDYSYIYSFAKEVIFAVVMLGICWGKSAHDPSPSTTKLPTSQVQPFQKWKEFETFMYFHKF